MAGKGKPMDFIMKNGVRIVLILLAVWVGLQLYNRMTAGKPQQSRRGSMRGQGLHKGDRWQNSGMSAPLATPQASGPGYIGPKTTY
jgi:hypothetical protein